MKYAHSSILNIYALRQKIEISMKQSVKHEKVSLINMVRESKNI